ncbi:MAG: twin-arginine translocase TatA/TatE family subunit [Polyangiaceae bacterium]|nr:twin-arginine translocase TatA/TatE family subunit [Polyangiaceae bacterium]
MFGISFTELVAIAVIALVFVGPQKLPGMLRTLGEYMVKLRRLTSEVRQQTGIDDLLRQEGIEGGLTELRGILRGELPYRPSARGRADSDPYADEPVLDPTREYPVEGPDAAEALPDDLVDDEDLAPAAPAPPEPRRAEEP